MFEIFSVPMKLVAGKTQMDERGLWHMHKVMQEEYCREYFFGGRAGKCNQAWRLFFCGSVRDEGLVGSY
jgi:hypothetical protein